ncbi:MAG: DUF1553 domain-containing protein [Planctomycetes bacterium]|nr:DUF1553 domain-containing protein [Planctomycetota bacterium]
MSNDLIQSGLLVAFAAAFPAAFPGESTLPTVIRYDRDIRPLLADRCFTCHGPDDSKRRGKLRLDDPEFALAQREHGAALVPGDVDASELWARVTHESAKKRMPPADSRKKPLTQDEQELLRRWIEQGAKYETHWSFTAPTRPDLPTVRHPDWSKNPIDRFIAQKLEAQGVPPGALADRATLLRRLFLELTGLPPTLEELDAFVADARPDAYERQVDRIFAEEPYKSRYAERMATPWLDAARYADTCGIHTDAGRQIWPWRDWLLGALRDNLPFDRFVTEQLAGDLLPDATEATRIASGFHRNHVTTDEGGAIAEEYLVEYAVDRVATTGSVFLGLTVGCARCHDHKYDPLTQRDFYSLYAFFNSIEEPGLYSQLPDSNRAFEPAMKVPSTAMRERLVALDGDLVKAREALSVESPEEREQEQRFFAERSAGASWAKLELVKATAASGATLAPQADGSLLASGTNPATDDFEIQMRTSAAGLRLLRVEALVDPSLQGRVGRAPNGNAVLSGVTVTATSLTKPARTETVRFGWAWANVEQMDGDYRAVNVLDAGQLDGSARGWAVAGHEQPGDRTLLLLADQPFGFAGGSELQVTLQFRSTYAQYTFGRVRVGVAALADEALATLPAVWSGTYVAGSFAATLGRDQVYDAVFGPEQATRFDFAARFGAALVGWRFEPSIVDGQIANLQGGVGANYLARRLFVPTARRLVASLGSDDSFRLFLDGVEVAGKPTDRGVAPDQERLEFDVAAGEHLLVLKIGNTGGPTSSYWRPLPAEGELAGPLVATLLPAETRSVELTAALHEAWKQSYSPGFRERRERFAAVERERAEVEARTPQTMVMQELATPRPTFVLMRGEYDKADPSRPVERAVPASLGRLPDGAPKNRLGLAQWLTSAEQPLTARVAVNRWWELLFGTGLVATSEDFGFQGEWPSHPELLDWLAVELRDGGYDMQRLLRLIVTSATFRQSAVVRSEVAARDPGNRWLGWFPRRRLDAEQLRDQALYTAGLLIEQFGGPSVKPYQPDGLWNEVAMPASNTRFFVRGGGDELWRRSVYTYWKRACPPPALQTFDAPTREFCTIRRTPTSTPLQALALWNDEQLVEAARLLAERTLREGGDDAARLTRMHRRCTARGPTPQELDRLAAALQRFRARYAADPVAAAQLVEVGESPTSADLPAPELAAWTLIASALQNLDATITRS